MMNSRLWGRLFLILMALPQLVVKPWKKKPVSAHRILVLSHLLLGDTLMLTALLKRLHCKYPDAILTLVCQEAVVPLYQTQPYGINAIAFNPKKFSSIFYLIRHCRQYDLAFIPGDNRWSWLALAMGSRWIVAFSGGAAWKNLPISELKSFPVSILSWGDLVASLAGDLPRVEYNPDDWIAPSCYPFDLPSSPYAVLHLGASKPHKYWDADNWMAVAEWLRVRGITIVWSVGAKEITLLESIRQMDGDYCYKGELDLTQLWHLLKYAQVLVCPDTGIAHLGRLTNTPTIALFGPGSPLISGAGSFWKNSPFMPVWDESVLCRDMNRLFQRQIPWVKHCLRGSKECPAPYCMDKISVDNVLELLTKSFDSVNDL